VEVLSSITTLRAEKTSGKGVRAFNRYFKRNNVELEAIDG
jgi:uncharacterized protein YjbK